MPGKRDLKRVARQEELLIRREPVDHKAIKVGVARRRAYVIADHTDTIILDELGSETGPPFRARCRAAPVPDAPLVPRLHGLPRQVEARRRPVSLEVCNRELGLRSWNHGACSRLRDAPCRVDGGGNAHGAGLFEYAIFVEFCAAYVREALGTDKNSTTGYQKAFTPAKTRARARSP